jgi:RimJ/RimL family protein N-acetyltransferase
MVPVPTLTAGTVVLRAPRPDDALGVWEQCQDPLSQRWTSVPVPYARADAEEFLGRTIPDLWEKGEEHILVVEAEGRFAGSVALRPFGHDRAEIGFGAHPWVRGTGHVHTALGLVLDWGFARDGQGLGLQTVEWRAHVGNWRSRKAAWRQGFTIGGMLRHWLPHRGRLVDCWVGSLHRDDPREPQGRWLAAPVLEGDRVRLRPPRLADVPRVVEAYQDDVTRHWLSRLPEPEEETALRWLESVSEQQATGDGTSWAVADPATDTFLGTVGFFDVGPRDCEVTYWVHPDARGRGIGTAATRLATGWAFAELGMARVEAHAAVDNLASRRVLAGAGYREGGVVRHGTRTRSGPADAVHYDVLATEWPTATPSP